MSTNIHLTYYLKRTKKTLAQFCQIHNIDSFDMLIEKCKSFRLNVDDINNAKKHFKDKQKVNSKIKIVKTKKISTNNAKTATTKTVRKKRTRKTSNTQKNKSLRSDS